MTSFKSEASRIIDKFNEWKFKFWKFKIKMLLASIDFWDIMDGSKEPLASNADLKMLKEYQRCVKKAMSIIGLNLADNQLAHIKSCKRSTEAWKTFCKIYEKKNLSNILFVRRKYRRVRYKRATTCWTTSTKNKLFADQLACLEVSVRDEDIVIICSRACRRRSNT